MIAENIAHLAELQRVRRQPDVVMRDGVPMWRPPTGGRPWLGYSVRLRKRPPGGTR